jgi:hypothetical protein
MKNFYLIAIISLMNLNFLNAQTTFEWLTATDNGLTITETLNGITTTFTGTNDGTSDMLINSPGGFCGSSNNVAWEITLTTMVTFTFSETVDITSVLAMNGNALSNTYTFTPIGGSNSPVVISVVSGCAPVVDLNWTNITSFTVSTPTTNQFGFDDLILSPAACSTTFGTDVQSACATFDWIDGNTYTASNNTATFTLMNAAGCDSIVTLDLTVNQSTTGTDVQSACGSFNWIDGNTYTVSNNSATHTLTNAVGCDSIVTLDLTINTPADTSTSVDGITITANAAGATYQWIDCNNGDSLISGESNQSFTPIVNGDFAVIVTENGCSDTSSCVNINTIGFPDIFAKDKITIYPNPTSGLVNIDFGGAENPSIRIFNTLSQIVIEKIAMNGESFQFELNGDPGIYFIEIRSFDSKAVFKIIKE